MRGFFVRIVCIILALCAAAAACGFARVFPRGTSVGGADISRRSRAAAAARVREHLAAELAGRSFTVRVGEDSYVFRPPELYYDAEIGAALDAAQRGGDVPLQKRLRVAGLEDSLRGICDNYYKKSAGARILFDPDKEQPFTVVRQRAGAYVDGARLLRDAEEALAAGREEVRAEPVRVTPSFGEEEALRSVALLSSFTTCFNTGNAPRAHNIRLAAKTLNGVTLAAGESFSFNAGTGARTAANGYREAPIIKEGEYIPGVGGGVCQVSTTLYNAALLAGLTVTEHHAHSLPVGYVEPSFDAMVSGRSCDLKLKNGLTGKVYFVFRVRGNELSVRVYGPQSAVTYTRESVTTGTIEPPAPEVRENASENELRAPKAGLTSEGYLICREAGKPARRILLRKDRYAPQRGVVRAAGAEGDRAAGAEGGHAGALKGIARREKRRKTGKMVRKKRLWTGYCEKQMIKSAENIANFFYMC